MLLPCCQVTWSFRFYQYNLKHFIFLNQSRFLKISSFYWTRIKGKNFNFHDVHMPYNNNKLQDRMLSDLILNLKFWMIYFLLDFIANYSCYLIIKPDSIHVHNIFTSENWKDTNSVTINLSSTNRDITSYH